MSRPQLHTGLLIALVAVGGGCYGLNPAFETGLIEAEIDTGESETCGAQDGSAGAGAASDACPADPSLVACYRFEADYELIDESASGNHGFASNVGTSAGISGLGLDCATSEAVQIPDSPSLDLSDAMTLSLWVRPEAFPAFGRAVWLDNSGQYATMFDANAGYVCRAATSGGSFQVSAGPELVPLGVWTHIACSYDGVMSRLYANGEQVASLSATGSMLANNSEPVTIGSNSPTFDETCSGQIDGVQIYSRALTGDEIATLAGR